MTLAAVQKAQHPWLLLIPELGGVRRRPVTHTRLGPAEIFAE